MSNEQFDTILKIKNNRYRVNFPCVKVHTQGCLFIDNKSNRIKKNMGLSPLYSTVIKLFKSLFLEILGLFTDLYNDMTRCCNCVKR